MSAENDPIKSLADRGSLVNYQYVPTARPRRQVRDEQQATVSQAAPTEQQAPPEQPNQTPEAPAAPVDSSTTTP